MKLQELIECLESAAPAVYQESYDNAGLLVGSPGDEVSKILLCLDSTEEVVDEALEKGCDLIIAHHPVIFSGLKKLNGKNDVERAVMKAIRHGIAIYAAHTNLDNMLQNGVNEKIAQKLGLRNLRILDPKPGTLFKLETYCPHEAADAVCNALFEAGAGRLGHYDECSFNSQGRGSFKGDEHSDPYVGQKGQRHYEPETKIELIVPLHVKNKVLTALLDGHPYEEVAYQLLPLDNTNKHIGSGMVGELEQALSEPDFLAHLKEAMGLELVKYTASSKKAFQKIAVCGGSGSFLVNKVLASGADAYITSDIKYHEFFAAEKALMLCDIGHYESEIFTLEIFYELINKKLPNFAVIFASTKTNPVKYFK